VTALLDVAYTLQLDQAQRRDEALMARGAKLEELTVHGYEAQFRAMFDWSEDYTEPEPELSDEELDERLISNVISMQRYVDDVNRGFAGG
jgi:hypothetical protein